MVWRRRRDGNEAGFTLVEIILAVLLFSIVAWVSVSLVTTTFRTLSRTLAEFESRKRVLLLQREMAEGSTRYAGYLAASDVSFGSGEGDYDGACVFWYEFPDPLDGAPREMRYVWWAEDEEIEQIYYDPMREETMRARLLADVASFVVEAVEGVHSLRVSIGHRVKGFQDPIVRSTEGQPRNMPRNPRALAEAIGECVLP